MKPNPDNQLRKRIADALLADDPFGLSDGEIERALVEVRSSGEAADLTDIEIGRILLKMRQKLPLGERIPDAEEPAPAPRFHEQKTGATQEKPVVKPTSSGDEKVIRRPLPWWRSHSGRGAIAALLVFGLGLFLVKFADQPPAPESVNSTEVDTMNRDGVDDSENQNVFADDRGRMQAPAAPAPAIAVGKPAGPNGQNEFVAVSLTTGSFEKLRVPLDDGSILFVNANSEVRIENSRELHLEKGEIFVEVAPRSEEDKNLLPDGATFTVKTGDGEEVTALGTKFGVRTTPSGPGVLVTQGTVLASREHLVLKAGQEMLPGPANTVSPSRRPAEALHWLKDLDEQAFPPAAPPNAFLGGVLIAYDGAGREKKIELKSCKIDVVIENGFATTTVDQTYSSELLNPVEAVFYFPVPPDAAVTRFASSAGNEMVEADIVPRDAARVAYRKSATAGGRPGLMEWQDASTFSMRVFPLEPGKKKRIQLSFSRRLNTNYGRTQFRLAGVGDAQFVGKWGATIRVPGGARTLWNSSSHVFDPTAEGPDLILTSADRAGVAHRDIVVNFFDQGRQSPDPKSVGNPRFSTYDGPGGRYLLVRHTPDLGEGRITERRDWIFLCETSADRDILEAKTASGTIRGLLEHVGSGDTFAIVAVGARVQNYGNGFKSVTPGNLAGVSTFLNRLPRLGALNVENGFAEAARLAASAKNPVIVHLGSGIPVLGERNTVTLLNLLPDIPYVGVGIGPRWNRPLMKAAAGKTGGFFTQINPDEPSRWRAFDLLSTLNAPRLVGLEVSAPNTGFVFHSFQNTLAQGEELCALAKLPPRAPEPSQIAIHGFVGGEEWHQVIDVTEPKKAGRYLADLWARLEIDRLVAYGGGRDQITAVSLTHHVLSPFTSFLTTPDAIRIAAQKRKLTERFAKAEKKVKEAHPVGLAGATTEPNAELKEAKESELAEALVRHHEELDIESPPKVAGGVASGETPVRSEQPALTTPSASAPVLPRSPAKPAEPSTRDDRQSGASPEPEPTQNVPELPMVTASVKPEPAEPADGEAGGGAGVADGVEKGTPYAENSHLRETIESEGNPGAGKAEEEEPDERLNQTVLRREVEALKENKPGESISDELEHPVKKTEETQPETVAVKGLGIVPADKYEPDDQVHDGALSVASEKSEEASRDGSKPGFGWGYLGYRAHGQLSKYLVPSEEEEAQRLVEAKTAAGFSGEVADYDFTNSDSKSLFTPFAKWAERNLSGSASDRDQIVKLDANKLFYHQPTPEFLFDERNLGRSDLGTEAKESEGTLSSIGKTIHENVEADLSDSDNDRGVDDRRDFGTTKKEVAENHPGSRPKDAAPADGDRPPGGKPLDNGVAGPTATGESEKETLDLAVPPADPATPSAVAPDLTPSAPNNSDDYVRSEAPGTSADSTTVRGTSNPKVVGGGSEVGDESVIASNEPHPVERKSLPESQIPGITNPELYEHYVYWKGRADANHAADPSEDGSGNAPVSPFGEAEIEDRLDTALESARSAEPTEDAFAVLLQIAQARSEDPVAQRKVAGAFRDLRSKSSALSYASKYESARALLKSGNARGSQSAFTDLYRSEFESGAVPAFDDDLPLAFSRSGDVASFYGIIRTAVEKAIASQRFEDAVGIAWQCQQTGHRDLADEVLERLEEAVPAEHMSQVAAAALLIFGDAGDDARTAEVLGLLIRDGASIVDSTLLRRAAGIAKKAAKRSLALDWLERALTLDYGNGKQNRPVAIAGRVASLEESDKWGQQSKQGLAHIRQDFGQLVALFNEHAAAMKTLEVSSPRTFSQRVVDVVEKWRALDPDPAAACKQAADVFTLLGDHELAWDYATTPLAFSPDNAAAWKSLAAEFGDHGLGDQAKQAQRAAEAAEAKESP